MSALFNSDKSELIITCNCGCEDAIHIKIAETEKDYGIYCYLTYMNSNWYREQDDKLLRCIGRKLKKIWAILRNKDFYYSEIVMNKADLEEFKKFVNSIE